MSTKWKVVLVIAGALALLALVTVVVGPEHLKGALLGLFGLGAGAVGLKAQKQRQEARNKATEAVNEHNEGVTVRNEATAAAQARSDARAAEAAALKEARESGEAPKPEDEDIQLEPPRPWDA